MTDALLPNGRQNVSFSEISTWVACSYRHKLTYVDKIDLRKPSPIPTFGTAVHSGVENFLKTRTMDVSVAHAVLEEAWKNNSIEHGFTPEELEIAKTDAMNILNDVPEFFDKTFPNWSTEAAEHRLFEDVGVGNHEGVKFKGYIDIIINAPTPRNPNKKWIIDAKTCMWGWKREKKQDPRVADQLVLYKNFWTSSMNVEPRDVSVAFLLLKRKAKNGQRCELVEVSAGPVVTGRSLKVLNNMVSSMKRGVAMKNRDSCTYCDFKGTEHCT